MAIASSLGMKHELKMKLSDRQNINARCSLLQNLTIALPKSALLIPTIHTEHLSRRYSVQVEITVRGKDVGKATVCVEVPMQIGYEDRNKDEAPRYQEQEERTSPAKPEEWIHNDGFNGMRMLQPPA